MLVTYKFVNKSPAFNKTCVDIKFHVYWYSGYLVMHLQEEGQIVKLYCSLKYLVYTLVSTCFVL